LYDLSLTRAIRRRPKLAFHGAYTDTDTDTDTDNDTDFLADNLARIGARMSACRSARHRNNFRKSGVGRVGEDPREDVRVGDGVVEFQLYCRLWICCPTGRV